MCINEDPRAQELACAPKGTELVPRAPGQPTGAGVGQPAFQAGALPQGANSSLGGLNPREADSTTCQPLDHKPGSAVLSSHLPCLPTGLSPPRLCGLSSSTDHQESRLKDLGRNTEPPQRDRANSMPSPWGMSYHTCTTCCQLGSS